ncbi:BCS1-like protein [Aphelenchoides besseyi]|nr:BCS1-like protein [Aphelenchoides besseyi]KAI6194644.1 BCS1-like protein [Aphelenchoides besseyi]
MTKLSSTGVDEIQDVKLETKSFFDRACAHLSDNPYFSAGAGLAGLGIAASVSKRLLLLSNTLFRRKFITSLSLSNEDTSYPWVLDYINKHSRHKARSITANSVIRQTESGRVTTSFYLLPGHGVHYLTYRYRIIQVERQREKQVIQRNGARVPLETVTLTTFGRDPAFWTQFLANATSEALSKEETGLVVYNAIGPEWRRMGNPRRKRPLESVVLAEGVANSIHDDVLEFIKSEKWYNERGIPYRRGYLLHGPPGTGKSSYISALAGHFGYSICTLSLSERTLDDDRLAYLLNNAPPNCFILLEDIDAAFVSRDLFDNSQHRAYEGMTRVTFSGLLNAIDGVASTEERLLFMTTNHIDRLDTALIRPGRIDMKQYFGNCTPIMLEQMFQRFFNASEDQCKEFASEVLKLHQEFSPAQIQGYLLMHKDRPQDAISNVSSASP